MERLCESCERPDQKICGDCDLSIESEKCPICGKPKKPGRKTCGLSCGAKLTSMRNGSPFARKDVREKSKQTMLSRYGAENIWGSDKGKDSIKKTNLERRGVEYALQDQSVREKSKKTSLEKYGVEYASQSKIFQEKVKQTCIKKYGKESYLGSNAYYETLNSNLGVKNPSQLESSRESLRQAWLEKTPLERNKISQKRVETMRERYGTSAFCINEARIIERYGSLEEYYSLRQALQEESNLKKYGVKNVWSIPEIREKLQSHHSYIKSKYEDEIQQYLLSIGVSAKKSRKELHGLELDFVFENTAIEFNGDYWHSSLYKSRDYHESKSKLCEEAGIDLMHIYEWEWNDPRRKKILLSIIALKFGKILNRVYARQCEVKKIENASVRDFITENHLQGFRKANVCYGLFKDGKLLQIMSFAHHEKYQWEIIRGCPGSNNLVVGGVSKLFNHFIKEYNPDSVFSYCDFNKFNGKSYEAIGMEFIGYTGPDKTWLINGQAVQRNPRKYKEYKETADAVIWGAVSKKYLWRKHEN